jgi:RNA polymerase sigma factor (sigma-70 family)
VRLRQQSEPGIKSSDLNGRTTFPSLFETGVVRLFFLPIVFTEREPTNKIKDGGKDREGDKTMTTIKYFDGTKTIEVEVTEQTAAGYREIQREGWRLDKRAERHQAAISLTQMEDENGYQLADTAPDPLEVICEKEDQDERREKINAAIGRLTDKQKKVLQLLYSGKSVTEVAELLGIKKQSVIDFRKGIQKKFQEILG